MSQKHVVRASCQHRVIKTTGTGAGILVNCDSCGVRFLPDTADLLAALEALTEELREGGKAPDLALIHAFILPKAEAAIARTRGQS